MSPDVVSLLPSAKQRGQVRDSGANFFNYYAGYSASFVEYCLDEFLVDPDALVLDPWNGSGTTTSVAATKGYRSVGLDLNPAMVLVARARLTPTSEARAIVAAARRVSSGAMLSRSHGLLEDDPLLRWFYPSTASILRSLALSLGLSPTSPDSLPPHFCVLGVALFRVTRQLLKRFRTTNPTWLRGPKHPAGRVRVEQSLIVESFKAEAELLSRGLSKVATAQVSRTTIRTADSRTAPLDGNLVDLVLGSPPYCTRIDYAIATQPELAVLGMNSALFRALRSRLSGSTLAAESKSVTLQPPAELAADVAEVLRRIEAHTSHGSANYYLPTIRTYFRDVHHSMSAIAQALRPDGHAILVVQDSYYKEIRLPVQESFELEGNAHGLRIVGRSDELIRSPKSMINTHSRKYRTTHTATESTLIFRKAPPQC